MIEIKPKKCKGTNGDTRGYGCGKMTKHRVYGLGKMCCYPKWLLNTEAGRIKLQKAQLKATKPRRELEKATKEHKSNKSLSTLLNSVKNKCHEYIRLRDKGKPCISCGAPWHSDFQAGHLFKSELFSTVRFDQRNINGQCQQCNLLREGNESNYHLRLPNRIGAKKYNELVSLANQDKQTDFKWNRQSLIEIREYYKLKIKELST